MTPEDRVKNPWSSAYGRALRERYGEDRQQVADTFFGGSIEAAEEMIDTLPYSEIPGWQDVVTVIEKYRELVGLPEQGPGDPS